MLALALQEPMRTEILLTAASSVRPKKEKEAKKNFLRRRRRRKFEKNRKRTFARKVYDKYIIFKENPFLIWKEIFLILRTITKNSEFPFYYFFLIW